MKYIACFLAFVSSIAFAGLNNVGGTIAQQNANAVAITGGSIDNTCIGCTTRANGQFTTLSATSLVRLAYGNSSAQSIPSGTATTVTNWTLDYDINSNFNASTGVFTAPRSTRYAISACLQFGSQSFTVGQSVAVVINKNGSLLKQLLVNPPATSFISTGCLTYVASLAANDTITILGYQTSGSSAALNNSANNNVVSIYELP